MRKILFTMMIVGLVATLAACGGKDEGKDEKSLTFGATAGPYSDMLSQAIIPGLEEKGYKVEVTEFSDYVQPNNALDREQLMQTYFNISFT